MTAKYFFVLLITVGVIGVLLASPAFAQENADPGLLPTSPFYFLKEWRRGVVRLFTFNPIAKADLELKIAEEKAAEAERVEEKNPENLEAIEKALRNYEETQEKLKARFSALKETSANPKVDLLLEKVAERTVEHVKLFEEIAKKFEETEIKELAEQTREKVEATALQAFQKDDPVKLGAKIEKALTEVDGNDLKHIRSLEFIDRLEKNAPDELQLSFERLRENFEERFKEDAEEFLEKEDVEKFQSLIKELPGDVARRSVILEELESKFEERFRDSFKDLENIFEDILEREKNIAEKAKGQLEEAKEKVFKLQSKIEKLESVSAVVRNLLAEAESNLKRAETTFLQGGYGEAFGQARSAEVLARNALRLLEETAEPEEEDLDEELRELEVKINKYEELLKSRGLTRENNVKAYNLLDEAKKHLGFARDAFTNNDLNAVELHLGHVKGYLRDLARLLESEFKRLPTVKPSFRGEVSNRCDKIQEELSELKKDLAEGDISEADYNRKVGILEREYENCPKPASQVPSVTTPRAESGFCTEQYDPICGADGKTYSNECFAGAAKVEIKYEGECRETSSQVERAPVTERQLEFFVSVDQDGRFNPQSITIKKGSKVTWVNKGKRDIWPASAIHPTHEVYPGFDAKRGIAPGGSYSFVFDRVGSWKYHDHLNASETGVVEVTE